MASPDKDKKKRVTTAPLSEREIAETIHEIPEEEFLSKFDEILARFADGLANDERAADGIDEVLRDIAANPAVEAWLLIYRLTGLRPGEYDQLDPAEDSPSED